MAEKNYQLQLLVDVLYLFIFMTGKNRNVESFETSYDS